MPCPTHLVELLQCLCLIVGEQPDDAILCGGNESGSGSGSVDSISASHLQCPVTGIPFDHRRMDGWPDRQTRTGRPGRGFALMADMVDILSVLSMLSIGGSQNGGRCNGSIRGWQTGVEQWAIRGNRRRRMRW